MIELTKIKEHDISKISDNYRKSISVPLDDMWEDMIIPSGSFYAILDSAILGHCVINEDGFLMQFHLKESFLYRASEIFDHVCQALNAKGAYVATFESDYLCLCLDKQKTLKVDTILYHESAMIENNAPLPGIEIKIATMSDYEEVLNFCVTKVGIEGDWMQPYYQNLLPAKSVYLFSIESHIIAIGELRPSKSSNQFANLGIMVSSDYRRKSLGSYVMSQMRMKANNLGLKGICSTTVDNLGARKAIVNSGFDAYHRILKCDF